MFSYLHEKVGYYLNFPNMSVYKPVKYLDQQRYFRDYSMESESYS